VMTSERGITWPADDVEFLQAFRKAVEEFLVLGYAPPQMIPLAHDEMRRRLGPERHDALRRDIIEMRPHAKRLAAMAGANVMVEYPPPAIGGPVIEVHLLDAVTSNPTRQTITRDQILEVIDHTIGASKSGILRADPVLPQQETATQMGPAAVASISRPGPAPPGHRIFLVHGHDQAVLQEVARFLERLDQDVIILREQPNRGRTIIEKFEDYSDVGYAVILLTPDDRGGPASNSSDEQHSRARQNVILELGYFLGRLGRSRVCALYREGVEIPSDYSGVLYVKLDAEGGWRLKLAKELRGAGLPVDMNRAL
jgi:predicted nucleotide-binding protein